MENIFWKNINLAQRALYLDDKSFSSLLDLSEKDFIKRRRENKFLSIQGLDNFCKRFNTSIDDVITGTLDISQIQNAYWGKFEGLPSKYDFGKLSKSRTIINCLDYLKVKYGERVAQSLLRSMQIDQRFFDDPTREMNIYVLVDFCKYLRKNLSFTDEEFQKLGEHSYEVYKGTELGNKFSSHKNMFELIDALCSEYSLSFEKNFQYKISKVTKNEIYVESRPTELAKDTLKTHFIGDTTTCQTKIGVFNSLPKYLGITNSKTLKTKCIFSGDQVTEYKLSF